MTRTARQTIGLILWSTIAVASQVVIRLAQDAR